MNLKYCLMLCVVLSFCLVRAQLPDASTHHLRYGQTREWSDFPQNANDSELTINFTTKSINASTLSLTQYDVNQVWKVILNNKHLGNLTIDEKKMVSYFDIPAGLLKKANRLSIKPERLNTDRSDDITLSHIFITSTLVAKMLSEVTLHFQVEDDTKTLLPSKLTIIDKHGSLQPVAAPASDTLAVRAGVIYSSNGLFNFSLPAGEYKVYASRGFEYGVDSFTINAKAGDAIDHRLRVKHEVSLKNWKGVDTHIHTREFSGHGDASMSERIMSIAGEGLDYGVITEHNKAIDVTALIKEKKLDSWITAITGEELTTPVGHFNILPATPQTVPDPNVKTWKEVKENLDKISTNKVIILNHARDEHNGVRPIDSLESRTVTAMPFNAMEVMNSGSQQTDPRQLYKDWLTLMARGIILTPIGSSDSHDMSRFIVGQSRTYVRADGDVVDNILNGRAGVSFGLFTQLEVDSNAVNGKTGIKITVHAPSWVKPRNVKLFANGQQIFDDSLSDKDKQVGNNYTKELNIELPPQDLKLVAIAEGADPKVPWWPIARPYSWTSPDVTPIVLGISEVVTVKKH